MRPVVLVVVGMVGCASPELRIVAPGDGDVFQVGTDVHLEAEVLRADGTPAATEPLWITPGWEGQGNPLVTDELPYGDFSLRAEATVEGKTLVDAVEVSLRQVVAPVDYVGVLDMDSFVHSPIYGDFELHCDHEDLHFVVDTDGSFSGAGACSTTFTDFAFDKAGLQTWRSDCP